MLPAQPNQSLVDGLAVLQAVSAASTPIGSRDLARRLGLEPTRVNRLLKTLAALGLTQQDAARKYAPGPGLHVLAATALFGSRLLSNAVGPVEALRRDCPGLTAALGVLWRREVAYLLFAPPGTPLAEGVGRTAVFPAENSSIGRVLLAARPVADIAQLFGNAQVADLLTAVASARELGYALVAGPPEVSLAVPVGPFDTATAAIALAGPITPDAVPPLVDRLRRAADDIHARCQSESFSKATP